jgi:uncharacterized membrane protein YedE/YeeE
MSPELWLGLGTGLVFGALLQQGRVARFEKQVGAMLFRDMTIFKFMLSAIIVGMIGINLLAGLGVVSYSVKATAVGANLIGGALFGAGWAVMGYCPGTSVAALAEGRWHAVWAILGMLGGAAIYAEVYPALKGNVLSWGKFGKVTLATALGVSPWVIIPVLVAGFVGLFVLFEKKKV